MHSSFALIERLVSFLAPLDVEWCVSGGWAIDLHLNRITRARCDLDISVPFSDRLRCVEFFLGAGWVIEGKLAGGFSTLRTIADYQDTIHYTWCFPAGADFISEYVDESGYRRLAYNREAQQELDYLEVFFDQFEDRQLVYRRDSQVRRHQDKAIFERDGVRYLAPEWVLLFKSNRQSKKNQLDFAAVVESLDRGAVDWLRDSLSLLYDNSHPWIEPLKAKIAHAGVARS